MASFKLPPISSLSTSTNPSLSDFYLWSIALVRTILYLLIFIDIKSWCQSSWILLIDGLCLDRVPILLTQQTLMVFLGLEPTVQAMFVEGMHTGPLNRITRNGGIIHTYTVVTDGDKFVFTNITVFTCLITDPTSYCIPFNQLKNRFFILRLH